MIHTLLKFTVLLIFISNLTSCVIPRAKLDKATHALRQVPIENINFSDDLGYDNLSQGLLKHIKYLQNKEEYILQFGQFKINSRLYADELEKLYYLIKKSPDFTEKHLHKEFLLYEVYGEEKWGQVFLTSYFAPLINGSKVKTQKHSQPLYGVPDDMVTVHWDTFLKAHDNDFLINSCKEKECKFKKNIIKEKRVNARLVKTKGSPGKVLPYFSRSEIEKKKASFKANVLAWVEPIDAFTLHVQGSGTVRFSEAESLNLGHAAINDLPYYAIGKELFHVIPKEKMSLQRIEAYLRSLSETEAKKIMNKNPRYVFFRVNKNNPVTDLGIEAIPGRSIATDKRFYPKGALALLNFKKPFFSHKDSLDPSSWRPISRFVLDHEVGGAIKGGSRVDLFWGNGAKAKQHAGVMRQKAELYYLLPKNLLKKGQEINLGL